VYGLGDGGVLIAAGEAQPDHRHRDKMGAHSRRCHGAVGSAGDGADAFCSKAGIAHGGSFSAPASQENLPL